jgi:hypothetical protein
MAYQLIQTEQRMHHLVHLQELILLEHIVYTGAPPRHP